jgi:4-diphosphocytidyl-2-C-methyl-D-erythritol kinase
MTVEAYAKINLTLEVYGKRPDGYHELRSVVLPISLCDTLEFKDAPSGEISTDTGYGENDLVVKALRALKSAAGKSGAALPGVNVHVVKRIPAGGGLGGGSADAAAALLAMNEYWGLNFAIDALADIGALVGSDVPALVLAQHGRRPVMMKGRGENVSFLGESDLSSLGFAELLHSGAKIILANPGVSSSTAETYARCTPRQGKADGELLLVNDLQSAACSLHPEIATALTALMVSGARNAAMSGSGSTVYAFAADDGAAENIAAKMQALGCKTWVAQPLTVI